MSPSSMHTMFHKTMLKPHTARETTVRDLIAKNGFPYSRPLTGHSSCVNALAFSSGDGQWLSSAGDDLRINLYDFHQEDVTAPSCTFLGPRANVFSLCFSANNRYLYCGATDNPIYKYDLYQLAELTGSGTRGYPSEIFQGHSDSIRDISCHPSNDDILLSASEDGRVILRDGRVDNGRARAQGTLQIDSEVSGVRWHPQMEQLFAVSDNRGRLTLRDSRMAFGSRSTRTSEPVVNYVTSLVSSSRVGFPARPEISSITWDRDGKKLGVTMLNYLPVIYSPTDPWPLAVCSSLYLPDGSPIPPGQRAYSNACTIKHGSFGGPGLDQDSYYSAGSEDFRAYVWKVPDIGHLEDRRQEMSFESWSPDALDTLAFAQKVNGPRYIPVDLSQPLFRLTGHKSIVNTTLFHPTLLHMVTAGVERHVVVHSPTPSSPCTRDLQLTPSEVRELPRPDDEGSWRVAHALSMGLSVGADEDGDSETIALFDEILRDEGDGIDLFATRRVTNNDSSSDSEGSDDSL